MCVRCQDCGTFQCVEKKDDNMFVCEGCHKKLEVVYRFGSSSQASDIENMVQIYSANANKPPQRLDLGMFGRLNDENVEKEEDDDSEWAYSDHQQ